MFFRRVCVLPAVLFAATLVVTSPSSAVSGTQSLAPTDRPATPAKTGQSPSERRPASFEAPHAAYAMLTSNAFFGSATEARQRALQAAHGAGRDYLSGNTFSPWQAPPPWTAPGDPAAAVPLPPVKPDRYNAALRFMPCPAP